MLKYKVNYNPVVYDFRSGSYRVGTEKYQDYQKAREQQWRCEKCDKTFCSFKELRLHKLEYHSY